MSDLAALKADLGAIDIVEEPTRRRLLSRDFYWYSPVLKRQLDGALAELIVVPRDEAQVIATLRACHRHRVAVTPRGTGTGNYGQAMPLDGGVVLDLSRLTEIEEIALGRVRVGAGAKLGAIDAAAKAHSGQELRMHPSTARTATIGGFVCGGSGGIGSITWGGLLIQSQIAELLRASVHVITRSHRLAWRRRLFFLAGKGLTCPIVIPYLVVWELRFRRQLAAAPLAQRCAHLSPLERPLPNNAPTMPNAPAHANVPAG